MRKLLIFDFDGTLVDTITDVGLCFNQALRENGFPEHQPDSFSEFVGGDLETVISKMLPPGQATPENLANMKVSYRKLYSESAKENTRPYPGIYHLLCELKNAGFYMAINSNKGQSLLDQLVKDLFPDRFFDAVVGYQEARPPKPSPYGVELICEIYGCSITEAIYIGDGKSDIDTAANAGIPCIFVLWGQGTEVDRADDRVALRVSNCKQLKEAIWNCQKTSVR